MASADGPHEQIPWTDDAVVTFPPVPRLVAPCAIGYSLCVLQRRDVVVVTSSCGPRVLHAYALSSGALLRSFGDRGAAPGQFGVSPALGGLAASCNDTVLVAEDVNSRLQEVDDHGGHVRFVGVGRLGRPTGVAADADVVAAVDAQCRVWLFNWSDAAFRTAFACGDSGGEAVVSERGGERGGREKGTVSDVVVV